MYKPHVCDFEDLLVLFVHVRMEIYFYIQILIKVSSFSTDRATLNFAFVFFQFAV